MDIGIIGAGMVGGTLTKAFARLGHQVLVSSSDPTSDKMDALIGDAGKNARGGTNADAVAFGSLTVLATPWGATPSILKSVSGWDGQIVIDKTNPIKADFSGLEDAAGRSGGAQVQNWLPSAHVVKTLNQIGFMLMDNPDVAAGKPVMFMAGENADAKSTIGGLLAELGFAAEDAGGINMARYLEGLAWIWINRAMIQNKGRDFAFVLSPARPLSG